MKEFKTMKKITYSPSYTIVITYECFNYCTYCNFRINPQLGDWLKLTKAKKTLEEISNKSISEILILSGEIHPRSPERKLWLQNIYYLCEIALSMNFLPHINVGLLTYTEMKILQKVSISMGLMIEQSTPILLDNAHYNAPSKIPNLRLQHLEFAGKLQIPFTTGVLLNIGEKEKNSLDTLRKINLVEQQWNNIQEVILQPHSPEVEKKLHKSIFNQYQLVKFINKAKNILPASIKLQLPPNLIQDPNYLLRCVPAGNQDLGGISPKDEINPNYSHFSKEKLSKILKTKKLTLTTRLPIYSNYKNRLSENLQKLVNFWQRNKKST